MMQLYLATSNPGKLKEFKELLAEGQDEDNVEFLLPHDLPDVEETEETLQGNALLKASSCYNRLKLPSFADDSGLFVSALPGELGVKSARFGDKTLDDEGRMKLLLEKMKGIEDRSCYFACVLCFYLSKEEQFFFEGRLKGEVAHEIRKGGGFGYDGLFIPEEYKSEGIHLSELSDWKKKNSHRALAFSFARKFFQQNYWKRAETIL